MHAASTSNGSGIAVFNKLNNDGVNYSLKRLIYRRDLFMRKKLDVNF